VGGRISAAVTLGDDIAPSKSGRVNLDEHCRTQSIPLYKTANINSRECIDWLIGHDLDWLFVIGWSQIARRQVLDTAVRGAIGMHPSLLPIGRGRAAIPWAILKQLPETGVSLFQLSEGVDSGPLLRQERIPLDPRETATTLYAKVEVAHRKLIRHAWPLIEEGLLTPVAQDETISTVWPGRTSEDGRLNARMSVEEADRLIRATTRPYPGAFLDRGNERLRIWRAIPATSIITVADDRFERIRFADGDLLALDLDREAC